MPGDHKYFPTVSVPEQVVLFIRFFPNSEDAIHPLSMVSIHH